MHVWLYIGALSAYVAASLVLMRSLAGGERTAPRLGAALGAAGVCVHVGAAVAFTTTFGELPLVGLGASLSTLALLMALWATPPLFLRDSRPLGVVLLPLAALLLGAGLLLGMEPMPAFQRFRGLWFELHVLLTMTGYACFAGAFAAALLYLLQHRELKDKRFGRVFRFLPPLDTLQRWQRRALEVGLPALSLGLLVGWAWTERFERTVGPLDPKVVWGLLTWVLLGAALLAQIGSARRRRGALVSVVGFVVVVLLYVVLRVSEPGRFFL